MRVSLNGAVLWVLMNIWVLVRVSLWCVDEVLMRVSLWYG